MKIYNPVTQQTYESTDLRTVASKSDSTTQTGRYSSLNGDGYTYRASETDTPVYVPPATNPMTFQLAQPKPMFGFTLTQTQWMVMIGIVFFAYLLTRK